MVKSFLQLNVSSILKGNSNPWGFPLRSHLQISSSASMPVISDRGGCDNFAEKMMKATAAKKWCFLEAMTAGQPQPVHAVVLSGSATGLIPWDYIAAQLNSKINLYWTSDDRAILVWIWYRTDFQRITQKFEKLHKNNKVA